MEITFNPTSHIIIIIVKYNGTHHHYMYVLYDVRSYICMYVLSTAGFPIHLSLKIFG